MQRFLAEAVACDQERLAALVPEGECKHATQFLHAIGAHLFVKMNNDFGIGVSIKTMAAGFEFRPQFRKIVNFAIEDDPRGTVFVEDGLMTAGKVNDAEPPHSQTGVVSRKNALVVG